MENQLITAAQVIYYAFQGCDYTPTELVTSAAITSAQQRYLLPILGEELIEALLSGEYQDLLEDHVEPVMALYTRVEMTPVEDQYRKVIVRQARMLARRMSDHLEDNAAQYPEYKSECNVLRKIRLYGATIEHA